MDITNTLFASITKEYFAVGALCYTWWAQVYCYLLWLNTAIAIIIGCANDWRIMIVITKGVEEWVLLEFIFIVSLFVEATITNVIVPILQVRLEIKLLLVDALPAEPSTFEAHIISAMLAHQMSNPTLALLAEIYTEPLSL